MRMARIDSGIKALRQLGFDDTAELDSEAAALHHSARKEVLECLGVAPESKRGPIRRLLVALA